MSGAFQSLVVVSVCAVTSSLQPLSRPNPEVVLWGKQHFAGALEDPVPLPPHQRLSTYLDGIGLRGVYNATGGRLSLALIEDLLENDLFLSGPHQNGTFDVHSNAFGRYNPAAITELVASAELLLRNPAFVAASRKAYDLRLKRQVRAYHAAYLVCQGYPEAMEAARNAYRAKLIQQNTQFFEFGLDRQFADFAEQELGLDWYEANTAVGFWLRRSIDHSAPEFHEGLRLLVEAYDHADPGRLAVIQRFEYHPHPFPGGE